MASDDNLNLTKGEMYLIEQSSVTQVRVNTEAVKAACEDGVWALVNGTPTKVQLTQEQKVALSKEIQFSMMKTVRHTGKKPEFVMPNLANATLPGLIDMLGLTREEMKDLKKLEGMYKDAIEARQKEKLEEGNK